ncbi:NADPH-dependent F420 reductase [Persicitalea jodogahamensis]|uniref:NADP oxidoreductase n=1 Tax=Persicitalea jodogahamensis TaxID=402147 RepID=A0A8J3D7V2_9BACT|nr:NAD(P)-binding domain-containing protein [Persicitalea jodogahamensis]GHB64651.1 NADP oxidoreductase [Persicitalea jodogahamensis]
MKYKIGIIGSGNIGGTLGKHFAKAGHAVMFSSRHPEELEPLAEQAGNGAQVGTVEEAAQFGDVLLLAYPFGKTPEVAGKVGNLADKVLIDANNYYPGRDGAAPKEEMEKKGLLETEWTASYFPGAHVVKAFNSIFYKTLEARAFDKANPLAIPFAASDKDGREVIENLLHSIGFVGVSLGDLSQTKISQPDEKLYTLQVSEKELRNLI